MLALAATIGLSIIAVVVVILIIAINILINRLNDL